MALINTIREKSGVAVGAVAVGMLLFIVGGDLIGGKNRLFGRDGQVVGEVNGSKIELPEFNAALEQAKQNFANQQGRQPDEQATGYLRDQTWNQLLYRRAFQPEIDKLGLAVGDEEMIDMVQGDNPNPAIRQAFTDPKTGQFDKARLIEYLKNLDKLPPEAQAAYHNFEASLREFDRPVNKYNALLKNSVYVTSAEARIFDQAQNSKVNFRYLFVPYTSVSDSAFKPTDAQLQDYLDRHKARYKVEDGRSIEYIVVPETASKEDSAALRTSVAGLAEQFRASTNDSLFVRANSDQPYNRAYLSPADLPEKLRQQLPLKVGEVYGPYVEGNTLAIYKVTGAKAGAKPAARASHILIKADAQLSPEAKAAAKKQAQDILNKIKAGADFAAMARQFGTDGTKDQGGDLGWFDEGRMVPAFSKAVFAANGTGLLPNLVETSFGYHIVKVTAPKTSQTYQVAAVVKAVQPSDATREAAYARAEQIQSEASSLDAFRALPTKDKTLQKQEAKFVTRDAQAVGNLPNSREIVRWAFGFNPDGGSETKVGDVRKFDIGDLHVIAAVTDSRSKGTATIESIRPELTAAVRNELKAKEIMAKLAGKTGSLEDLAKIAGNGAVVQTAEGAAQAQGTIPNVGFEPDAVGRAFALKPGQKSAPIQGEQGVLVVEPTGVFPATPSDLKVVRQQLAQQRQQRQDGLIYEAIKGKAKVQDNRSKFF
jgi:peptidyl-prolyl cis-trans isomerase D